MSVDKYIRDTAADESICKSNDAEMQDLEESPASAKENTPPLGDSATKSQKTERSKEDVIANFEPLQYASGTQNS